MKISQFEELVVGTTDQTLLLAFEVKAVDPSVVAQEYVGAFGCEGVPTGKKRQGPAQQHIQSQAEEEGGAHIRIEPSQEPEKTVLSCILTHITGSVWPTRVLTT